jgi:hypothetical protein
MLATIDLTGIEPASVDSAALQAYLQQLVGQPFLHFRFSYGDELSLHFGQPRAYSSPKMKHLMKGSYILGTRASNWYIRTASPPAVIVGAQQFQAQPANGFKHLTELELEASNFVQRGANIVCVYAVPYALVDASPSGCGLSLLLSDGSSLLIMPESTEDAGPTEDDIADWELFTPYQRYLRVGPRMKWAYLPSNNSASPR